MLTYYNEAVHSLDAVGVDPIHIYDLATSKLAADNKIAGPILSLANPNARFGHAMMVPQSVGQARRSSDELGPRKRSFAYVGCNLVAAMPKLSLNSLPRSKFREAFCHVVRAFGIHPQFV
jgi:hypothetical protein